MKELLLRDGTPVLVDDEDFDRLNKFTWKLNNMGYPQRTTSYRDAENKMHGTHLLLHREVMNARKGQQVDHRDGNLLNCQKSNLRFSTQSQNRMNSRKMRGCRSQYKGVRWNSQRGFWYVRLRVPGDKQKERYIGQFPDEHTAAVAYDLWAHDVFGEFARSNFKKAI